MVAGEWEQPLTFKVQVTELAGNAEIRLGCHTSVQRGDLHNARFSWYQNVDAIDKVSQEAGLELDSLIPTS